MCIGPVTASGSGHPNLSPPFRRSPCVLWSVGSGNGRGRGWGSLMMDNGWMDGMFRVSRTRNCRAGARREQTTGNRTTAPGPEKGVCVCVCCTVVVVGCLFSSLSKAVVPRRKTIFQWRCQRSFVQSCTSASRRSVLNPLDSIRTKQFQSTIVVDIVNPGLSRGVLRRLRALPSPPRAVLDVFVKLKYWQLDCNSPAVLLCSYRRLYFFFSFFIHRSV